MRGMQGLPIKWLIAAVIIGIITIIALTVTGHIQGISIPLFDQFDNLFKGLFG